MKAIRIHLKQSSANYRREETVNCRMTYPLPPYSTVIGAIHKACGYTEYHPMRLSIQGKYGSMLHRMFKEDCFLNRLHDDRGILVKMKSTEILCSAYDVVAEAQKSQGNSFESGITINVVNQRLLDEYRFLNKTKKRIDAHKKLIKEKKNKLKELKNSDNISEEDFKAMSDKIKQLEKAYKKYEEIKYTMPRACFRTLTKAPKWYELLCDVELVIHVVSDDNTMQDIMENIHNLTAIGRGEDFVEIVDVSETELTEFDSEYVNEKYAAYIPCNIADAEDDPLNVTDYEGVKMGGTRYLLNKDYTLTGKTGSQKRIFNKIPVLFTSIYSVYEKTEGVLFDKTGNDIYSVFLA